MGSPSACNNHGTALVIRTEKLLMCSIPFFDASNCGVLEVLQVTGTAHGPFLFLFFIVRSLAVCLTIIFFIPCSCLQLAMLPLLVPLTVLFSEQEIVRLIGGMFFSNFSIL